MAILVAIAVNEDGYREVLDAAEGMKEDRPVDDWNRSNALPDLLGRYGICLLGHGVMKWRTSNIQTSPLPCGRGIHRGTIPI